MKDLDSEFQNLDIIDLISERHVQLRKVMEKRWNDQSDIYISNSEWYIIARIHQQGQTTMANLSKHVDISRQAIHKFIKRLEENGLVEINDLRNDKKKKGVQLTPLGKECFEKNEALKSEIKIKMADKIGKERIKLLNDILRSDWGI